MNISAGINTAIGVAAVAGGTYLATSALTRATADNPPAPRALLASLGLGMGGLGAVVGVSLISNGSPAVRALTALSALGGAAFAASQLRAN